jgi:hypothetical protein
MDVDNQLIYAVEAVGGQDTIGVFAGSSDGIAMPFIRQIETVGLTEVYCVTEEIRRMNGQDKVLQTITSGNALAGPFIDTCIRQFAIVEDIGLFVRDMFLKCVVINRMNGYDILDNTIAPCL